MRVSRLTMHNRKDFILTAESAKGAKDFMRHGRLSTVDLEILCALCG